MKTKLNQVWSSDLRNAVCANIEAKFPEEIEEVEEKLREALSGTDTEVAMTYETGEIAAALALYFRQRGFTTSRDYSSAYAGW